MKKRDVMITLLLYRGCVKFLH